MEKVHVEKSFALPPFWGCGYCCFAVVDEMFFAENFFAGLEDQGWDEATFD